VPQLPDIATGSIRRVLLVDRSGNPISLGGAPTGADYLVGTANGSLSGEIVVGTSPGGELGGTWASPTVDATHSGSTHSAAADTHIADATDAHDASAISIADAGADFTATDVEGALDELQSDNEAHVAAADPHTGYRLESADHTHQSTGAQAGTLDHGLALTGLTDDDHTQYQKESEKGVADGYASLGADALVPQDQLGAGVQDGTKFLRDDGTWSAPTASVTDPNPQSYTPGTFSVATGKYVITARRIQLTGSQRITLAGTAHWRHVT
jgi:hypothetical protein